MSLSKLMNMFDDAGKTFASPRLVRKLSYAACVWNTRIAGRSPSSGRWPRSWSFEATPVAAPAGMASTESPSTMRPQMAASLRIAPDSRLWRFAAGVKQGDLRRREDMRDVKSPPAAEQVEKLRAV